MFNRLRFEGRRSYRSGIQAKIFFPNGYGANVIRTEHSFGGRQGLYELAVLKGDDLDSKMCYDTFITEDVVGHLDEEGVSNILEIISNLNTVTIDGESLLYKLTEG